MSRRTLRSQALEVLLARKEGLTPQMEASLRAAFAAGRLELCADGKTFEQMTPCELETLFEENPALFLLMTPEVA